MQDTYNIQALPLAEYLDNIFVLFVNIESVWYKVFTKIICLKTDPSLQLYCVLCDLAFKYWQKCIKRIKLHFGFRENPMELGGSKEHYWEGCLNKLNWRKKKKQTSVCMHS